MDELQNLVIVEYIEVGFILCVIVGLVNTNRTRIHFDV